MASKGTKPAGRLLELFHMLNCVLRDLDPIFLNPLQNEGNISWDFIQTGFSFLGVPALLAPC